MTVNYTTLLGLAQPVTGTEANTWGTVVNDEITALVEEAVAKGATINVTAGDVTLTSTSGVSNQARNAILLITGTPGVSRNVIAPSSSKVYIIVNGSNAAVVIKGAATTGVTVATGATSLVAWNGSDFVEVGQAGDVDGPASSTANAIARFSGTTGKIIQNSGITIDASNNVSGMGTLGVGAITTTGVFTATAGTVSAPAITTTGDTNTGIFFPAADTIAFAEGGAEAMRIDSDGDVGIGTSSPAYKLHTYGSNSVGALIQSTGTLATISFQGSGSATNFSVRCGTDGEAFVAYTSNNERMRIDTSGNVGIGTTTPSGYGKLTVLGAGVTGHFVSNSGAGGITIYEGAAGRGSITSLNNGAAGLAFLYSTTEAMRIDSSGNVGIGTTSPTSKLSIVTDSSTSALTAYGISLQDTSTTSGDIIPITFTFQSTAGRARAGIGGISQVADAVQGYGGAIGFYTRSAADASNLSSTDERMRIDSSGNVGIGVTNPSTRLQVNTTINTAYSTTNTLGGGVIAYIRNNSTTSSTDATIRLEAVGAGAVSPVSISAVNTADGQAALTFGTRANNASDLSERMRIDSSGNVGIGTSSPASKLHISGGTTNTARIDGSSTGGGWVVMRNGSVTGGIYNTGAILGDTTSGVGIYAETGYDVRFYTNGSATERMRIDSSGNVGIGVTPDTSFKLTLVANSGAGAINIRGRSSDSLARIDFQNNANTTRLGFVGVDANSSFYLSNDQNGPLVFGANATERARITSGGDFLVGKTAVSDTTKGFTAYGSNGETSIVYDAASGGQALFINRQVSDGTLINFLQANAVEGSISVSGNTVSYNSFAGSHWSQLQQGRGYNPEILRGTVMSSIGEMCEWKSVVWDEVIEHPAVPAVDAKDAVLDEEGNVIEPAVEAVEGKDAWTETFNKREAYLGQLPIGATFEEDGVTKTVVDDGNERLPKVKISDVVGDKAVYGVFQTWDEVQDMLVTSLGAFVVRIAAGVTVQIGDLLESNGDGCAKVQDDDVIRSKTIGKVTSTTPSATYADGSYTVPAVLYCG